jgi:hypothetical protein
MKEPLTTLELSRVMDRMETCAEAVSLSRHEARGVVSLLRELERRKGDVLDSIAETLFAEAGK